MTIEEDWVDAGMARDTAVYAFGGLSETLGRTALGGIRPVEPPIRTGWEDEAEPVSLIEVHLEEGRAALYEGQAEHEYGMVCTHPSFHVTVAWGYDPARDRVVGVCLFATEGDLLLATRWAFRVREILKGHGRLRLHTLTASVLPTH